MADFKAEAIRAGVAKHKNTSPGTLSKLALDKHWIVRKIVALNDNTPDNVLHKLMHDPQEQVAQSAREALIEWRNRKVETEGLETKRPVNEGPQMTSEESKFINSYNSNEIWQIVQDPNHPMNELAKSVIQKGIIANKSSLKKIS